MTFRSAIVGAVHYPAYAHLFGHPSPLHSTLTRSFWFGIVHYTVDVLPRTASLLHAFVRYVVVVRVGMSVTNLHLPDVEGKTGPHTWAGLQGGGLPDPHHYRGGCLAGCGHTPLHPPPFPNHSPLPRCSPGLHHSPTCHHTTGICSIYAAADVDIRVPCALPDGLFASRGFLFVTFQFCHLRRVSVVDGLDDLLSRTAPCSTLPACTTMYLPSILPRHLHCAGGCPPDTHGLCGEFVSSRVVRLFYTPPLLLRFTCAPLPQCPSPAAFTLLFCG